MTTAIEVVAWGVAGRVVGLGRPGRAGVGASRGGAADQDALRLGNRLVGNSETSEGFESSGGLVLRFGCDTMLAVTGAIATVESDGAPVGWGGPVVVSAGTLIRVSRLVTGARTYITVRGGVHSNGEALRVGPDPRTPATSAAAVPLPLPTSARLWPGPRIDWFRPAAWTDLCAETWTVTATSRVGVRLSGAHLERAVLDDLPSEGVVEGAVQVPPDGQPIVMLADHPTTGGYPVIGVVDPADLTVFAQAALGADVHFVDARRRS